MPVRGRSSLPFVALALVAAAAGPAAGARHPKARLLATKTRAHGHLPPQAAQRPPLVGTLPVTSTTPVVTDPGTTIPAPSCPTAAIGVTEAEYYTHPSRTTVCPGTIVIGLTNAGQDDHDLRIVDLHSGAVVAEWATLHPGQEVPPQHVTLAAGTYRLFCTLSDGTHTHEELGMYATVTVG
jgi:plastocyanin